MTNTETIIANHPWVNDVEGELKRLEEERKEKAKVAAKAFGTYKFNEVDDEDEE